MSCVFFSFQHGGCSRDAFFLSAFLVVVLSAQGLAVLCSVLFCSACKPLLVLGIVICVVAAGLDDDCVRRVPVLELCV